MGGRGINSGMNASGKNSAIAKSKMNKLATSQDSDTLRNPLIGNETDEQMSALNSLTNVFISQYGFSGGWDAVRKRSEKKEVTVSSLGTFQEDVGKSGVSHYIDEISKSGTSATDSILVYRVGGKDYVADGNHRAVAAKLLGVKKINCYVFDFDKLANSGVDINVKKLKEAELIK